MTKRDTISVLVYHLNAHILKLFGFIYVTDCLPAFHVHTKKMTTFPILILKCTSSSQSKFLVYFKLKNYFMYLEIFAYFIVPRNIKSIVLLVVYLQVTTLNKIPLDHLLAYNSKFLF